MAECALCGDYETEHEADDKGSHFLGRCRARNYYGPGRNDYTSCDCPGFEPEMESADG